MTLTIDLHALSHLVGIVIITIILLSVIGAIKESAEQSGINGFALLAFLGASLALGVWLL